ncbi:MAG: hypothetical protein IH586_16750 [Anaerolineaceae bacterium]|nr:hypothetical protein [Anaerolineaceae bacterium]
MKLLKIRFLGLFCITLGFLLTSCLKADQEPIFTPLPSSLPVEMQSSITPGTPLQTATIRPTFAETLPLPDTTPPIANTWKPTPTQLVDTYPHKEVWISYEFSSAVHDEYEAFLGIRNFPKLVLYTDGQLIQYKNKLPIQTKILSTAEICNLFITLESLGLSKIQTNGTGSLDDPIYQNTTDLGRVYDAGTTILNINGSVPRRYAVYEPYKDHAVKQIKDIFAFLDQYTFNDMRPYHADRLSVYVQDDREQYLQTHPSLKDFTPIPWPADATPLSQNNEGMLSLEGEIASNIFDLTGGYPMGSGGLFVDNGVEYLVNVKPILPDEWRGDDCYSTPCREVTPFTPSFSCK